MKVAFFDAKPYEIESFNKVNERYKCDITYFESRLKNNNVALTKGFDVVCIFVNDIIDKTIIDSLVANGVKLIALRCAGYNNIDFKSINDQIKVVRVPSYSPYSIAEHTVALILSLNRKIHRAYLRTKEANFSLNGLLGFDLFGKTAGIIGTGRIAKIVINILRGFGMKVIA